MQPILTRMLLLLIAICPAMAAEFELQLAYSDIAAGPLTTLPNGNIPLPDGCVGQIIEHATDGRITPPDEQGNPTGGDCLLIPQKAAAGDNGYFHLNGEERLGVSGYFVLDPGLCSSALPKHPIYLRIWNAADPAQATHFYQTPLYHVTGGMQQLNFARAQLACCEVVRGGVRGQFDAQSTDDIAELPFAYNVLTSFPNPFNAAATLSFAIERNARVSITLYDVQGRIVRTLVNDLLQAGAHQISFSAPELTSGTYFAVLQSDGVALSTTRMMLLK